jgi:hypothetical protein
MRAVWGRRVCEPIETCVRGLSIAFLSSTRLKQCSELVLKGSAISRIIPSGLKPAAFPVWHNATANRLISESSITGDMIWLRSWNRSDGRVVSSKRGTMSDSYRARAIVRRE